jgi:hypothetical protein
MSPSESARVAHHARFCAPPQNEAPRDGDSHATASRLGKELGVPRATLQRDGAFAAAVDVIAQNVGEGARRDIRSAEAAYLRGKRYNAEKQPYGGQKIQGCAESAHPYERTSKRLARLSWVCGKSVRAG